MDKAVGPLFRKASEVDVRAATLAISLSVFEKLVDSIPEAFIALAAKRVLVPAKGHERQELRVEARVAFHEPDAALLVVFTRFVEYLEAQGRSKRAISTDWKHFLKTVTPNGDEAHVALLQFDAVMKSFAARLRQRGRGPAIARSSLNSSLN